jgi:hypothetical protein
MMFALGVVCGLALAVGARGLLVILSAASAARACNPTPMLNHTGRLRRH